MFLAQACAFIRPPQDLETHPDWGSFEDYAAFYDRTYAADELRARFNNFVANIEHVSNPSGFRRELNEFADMSEGEFKEAVGIGCYALPRRNPQGVCKPYQPSRAEMVGLPDTVDWRTEGAVTPVKNQGKCGSCWSFSATGAMEGAWARETGELISLSEQQLLDCSQGYGNQACNGGIMEEAFTYAIDSGMCPDREDPYVAREQGCTRCKPTVFMSSCFDVEPGNQEALKAAVAQQPVSVAIEADTSTFQLYAGGIVNSSSCGTNLDHGVLVVGYGSEEGKDYWIVKNSWGPDWGEDGYIKIARSSSRSDPGVCGIALQPSFPTARRASVDVFPCNFALDNGAGLTS